MRVGTRLAAFATAARARPVMRAPCTAAQPTSSLARALSTRPGIVAELKPASPTQGRMRSLDDARSLAKAFASAGARGISALTEPDQFGGSPQLLCDAAASDAPALMKDFVVTERQLDLARDAGASAVLLILPLLDETHSEWSRPAQAVKAAHARSLEVLLEVYDADGLRAANGLGVDIIGVNNRDLRDDALPVYPKRTARVLAEVKADVPVLALSGATSADDVRSAIEAGASGVLVGTSLMQAADPVAMLRTLMEGLE